MDNLLRFYLDEHLSTTITEGLRARGVDAVTTAEAGRAGQEIPDPDQLRYATAEGRVMVTRDRDFVALAGTGVSHAGILYLQRALSIGETVDYLELMAHLMMPAELRGVLLYCEW